MLSENYIINAKAIKKNTQQRNKNPKIAYIINNYILFFVILSKRYLFYLDFYSVVDFSIVLLSIVYKLFWSN